MLFKTGLSNRTDTLVNNRSLGLGCNTSTPSFSFAVARVTDIILDENHPKYESWIDIGAIFTEPIDNTASSNLSKSYPLFSQLKTLPLINEQVIITSIPKNLDYDLKTVESKTYYFNPIGIWNHPHNNANPNSLPFSEVFKKSQNPNPYDSPSNPNVPTDPTINLNSEYNPSQNTFIEKDNIYPLLPFMGDNIIEGRYGQSIRLGHTAKSDSKKKNNWSESGENGDPIMILRNGQSPNVDEAGWVPTTENIKDDLSSIYLTSTQKLPFSLANEDFISYMTKPILPSNYTKPQIALNSDRVVINAKTDSVLISGNSSVSLSSMNGVYLEAKQKICIDSTDVRLGSKDAKEPVLKGDLTVEYLKIIVKEIANLATALKTIQVFTGPNVVGVPDSAIQGPAKLAAQNLEEVLEQLDDIKSNFVKTI